MCKGGQLNAMDGIRLPVVSSLWWTRSPVIMYGGNFNDVVNQCYLNKEKRMKNWVTKKQSLQSHSREITTFCIFRECIFISVYMYLFHEQNSTCS